MKVTHITAHWVKHLPAGGIEQHFYHFRAGRDKIEEATQAHGPLIEKVEIPLQHVEQLSKRIKPTTPGDKSGRLGYISYKVEGHHATSMHYYPKDAVRVGTAKGLAAFLEKIAVQHLKKQGVRTIQTSRSVHESRRKQLTRLGLEPRRVYKIDDWLAALEKATSTTA